MMKKSNFIPSLVLCSICLAAALLLALINMFTAPIIAERENAAANEALVEVLPGATDFKSIEITDAYPRGIIEGYSANGGFVFRAKGAGRNGDIVIMVGVTSEGKIAGTKVISSEETEKYAAQAYAVLEGTDGKYAGMDGESYSPVIVAGSTMTSEGFAGAIKAALDAYIVANGGTVNNKTPEEILAESLNAALGTADVKFNKWFKTEVISGIDAVYEAAGGEGRVFVIGESLIGILADGSVVGDAADKDVALAANEIISASTLTELAKPDGASRLVTKIYKTASGNYLFEAKASGFSAEFGYPPTDIIFKISISSDGKIMDVFTVEQSESKGYGDKCQKDDYYNSWIGVGADDVVISAGPIVKGTTDPGAIAGATITSNGYQKAVRAVFNVFKTLTEGGEG
jgi:electron transport complex protein RnfG